MTEAERTRRANEFFVDSYLTSAAANFRGMVATKAYKHLDAEQLQYAAEELIRIRDEWRLRRRLGEVS